MHPGAGEQCRAAPSVASIVIELKVYLHLHSQTKKILNWICKPLYSKRPFELVRSIRLQEFRGKHTSGVLCLFQIFQSLKPINTCVPLRIRVLTGKVAIRYIVYLLGPLAQSSLGLADDGLGDSMIGRVLAAVRQVAAFEISLPCIDFDLLLRNQGR